MSPTRTEPPAVPRRAKLPTKLPKVEADVVRSVAVATTSYVAKTLSER
jgi:hypothetical protein